MAKKKSTYVCNECGTEHPRWQGQCNGCNSWNTLTEMSINQSASPAVRNFSGYAGATSAKVETLSSIDLAALPRFSSGFHEMDRVLGGGIVPENAMARQFRDHIGLINQRLASEAKDVTFVVAGIETRIK